MTLYQNGRFGPVSGREKFSPAVTGISRTIGGRGDIGAFEANFQFSTDVVGNGGNGTLPNGSTAAFYSVRFMATRLNSLVDYSANGEELAKQSDAANLLPFSYTILTGNLPNGLTLDPTNGLLSGISTQSGTFTFVLKATDTDGFAGAQAYILNVFGPTAANVSVSGRVTDLQGRALAGVRVIMTAQNGQQQTARTNSFGFYHFTDVEAGQSYVLNLKHKQYTFASQVVNVTEELTEINFVSQQ